MTQRVSTLLLVAAVAVCGIVGLARADMDMPVKTLKGTLACAKCVLKEAGATECQSVLQVKGDDKTVSYYLVKNDVEKTAHPKCCTKAVEGVTVTGAVMEKDSKMWITATKIDFPDEK